MGSGFGVAVGRCVGMTWGVTVGTAVDEGKTVGVGWGVTVGTSAMAVAIWESTDSCDGPQAIATKARMLRVISIFKGTASLLSVLVEEADQLAHGTAQAYVISPGDGIPLLVVALQEPPTPAFFPLGPLQQQGVADVHDIHADTSHFAGIIA